MGYGEYLFSRNKCEVERRDKRKKIKSLERLHKAQTNTGFDQPVALRCDLS